MSQKALAHSIARVAVEVLRELAKSYGDTTATLWEECSPEQQARAVRDVEMHLADHTLSISASHQVWMREQVDAGWTYGPAYDAQAKTNPKLVPYIDLPEGQRAKDFVFRGVVHAIAREQMR
jgi:hypothetical protein